MEAVEACEKAEHGKTKEQKQQEQDEAGEARGSDEQAPAETTEPINGEEERDEGEIDPLANPVDMVNQRLQARREAAQAAAAELRRRARPENSSKDPFRPVQASCGMSQHPATVCCLPPGGWAVVSHLPGATGAHWARAEPGQGSAKQIVRGLSSAGRRPDSLPARLGSNLDRCNQVACKEQHVLAVCSSL
ncbi:hypothetical protein ABBQ32_007963 [Trebouxia sp. C0010 RCD-2024]